MATRQDIQAVIIYMQGLFPNYKPNLDGDFNAIDAMLDVLGDLDTATLRMAVKAACMPGSGRQFAPSADEIRSAMAKLHAQAAGLKTAGEAWQEVMDAIRCQGCHNGTPEFSSPLVKRAVDAIGFEAIGMSDDVMVERAHFLKIYASLLDRAMEDEAQLPAVTSYIDERRQLGGMVRMLTDRMEVKK